MAALREKLHKMRQTDGDAHNEFAGVFPKPCVSASRIAENMAACGSGRNRWPAASRTAPYRDRKQA
jgi:hypothetical protein